MKKVLTFFLFISLFSCEKDNVICDTSFRSYHLYIKDTVEYLQVVDIVNDNILYSDSNLYSRFKVVDDSYLNIMGRNQQATLNIRFRYVGDTVHQRVHPVCIYTDDCHVNFYYPSDTL
jgi:hypothetical protein